MARGGRIRQNDILSSERPTEDQKRTEVDYLAFLRWKAMPELEREHDEKTLASFSEKYDIPISDIKSFLARPGFYDDLIDMTMKWAKYKTPEIIHMLYNRIQTDVKSVDVREWREMVLEHHKSKKERESTLSPLSSMQIDDEQYERIIRRESERQRGAEEAPDGPGGAQEPS